ncbi:hypothetical protein ACIRJO_26415 [Streptomyces sp. NPDC102394]|uniref:hypothetical protein n=1 Tax=Streptomyces sp. NPDC102394 TaxID=3366167 RepID=UPI00380657C6
MSRSSAREQVCSVSQSTTRTWTRTNQLFSTAETVRRALSSARGSTASRAERVQLAGHDRLHDRVAREYPVRGDDGVTVGHEVVEVDVRPLDELFDESTAHRNGSSSHSR